MQSSVHPNIGHEVDRWVACDEPDVRSKHAAWDFRLLASAFRKLQGATMETERRADIERVGGSERHGAPAAPTHAAARTRWVSVVVPSEHGGWGLTAEPALLGLLLRPSAAGALLSLAAVLTFMVRTPLKLVLVDRFRRRSLPRTRLAARVAASEIAIVLLLALGASQLSAAGWLIPLAIAGPLVVVELWFDMRSRSRRLIPELAGGVGIASVAAIVVLAGGGSATLAAGAWLELAGRSIGSIPFVRTQIQRLRHGSAPTRSADLAQVLGGLVAITALTADSHLAAGGCAVIALGAAQAVGMRRSPVPAKVIGLRQAGAGASVVLTTAAGVWLF